MTTHLIDDRVATGTHLKVFVLGNRGSGKTCFLAGLFEYGRAHQDGGAIIRTSPDAARFLEDVATLRRFGEWPAPTPGTTYFPFEVAKTTKSMNASMTVHVLDYPGEDLHRALLNLDEAAVKTVQDGLANVNALIVILDPFQDVDLGIEMDNSPDEVAHRQDVLLKSIRSVADRRTKAARKAQPKPDIMLVITKADRISPALRDEKMLKSKILEKNKNLIEKIGAACSMNTLTVRCTSAFGPTDEKGRPPAMPRPQGYDLVLGDLEAWMAKRETSAAIRTLIPFALLVAMIAAAWFGHRWYEKFTTTMDAGNLVLSDLRDSLEAKWTDVGSWPNWLSDEVATRLDKERGLLKNGLESGLNSEDRLKVLRSNAEMIATFPGNPRASEDCQFLADLNRRLEEVLFLQIEASSGDAQIAFINKYLREFRDGPRRDEVLARLAKTQLDEYDRKRIEISTMVPRTEEDLRTLAKDLLDLESRFGGQLNANGIEPEDLRKSASVCESLAGANGIRITVKRLEFSGEKGKNRDTQIKWWAKPGSGVAMTAEATSSDDDDLKMIIECTIGLQFHHTIQLIDLDGGVFDSWGWEMMARKSLTLWELVGLSRKGSKIDLDDNPDDDDWDETNARITTELGPPLDKVPEDALRAFYELVATKTGWNKQ